MCMLRGVHVNDCRFMQATHLHLKEGYATRASHAVGHSQFTVFLKWPSALSKLNYIKLKSDHKCTSFLRT